jgi:anti-anti-sigma regulatory factor
MPATQLTQIYQEGPTLVVRFLEAINAFDDEVFERWPEEWDRLRAHIEDATVRNLLVDFSELEYFGSIMLKRLFKMWKLIEEKAVTAESPAKGQMAVCDVSDVGQEILRVAGFPKLCPIYSGRADALAALGT